MDSELWKKISERVIAASAVSDETAKREEATVETAEQEETTKQEEATVEETAPEKSKEEFFNFLNSLVEQPPTQPLQPTQSAQPLQPTQSAQPLQPTQSAQPLQPTQSAQPLQPTQSAQPLQPTQSAQPLQPTQVVDDIDENELAAILTEEGLNAKQLKSVLTKVEQRTYKRAVEDLTRDLYPVMQQVAVNVAAWSSAATRFRQNNPDLEPAMKFVAEQSNRIANAHPDWSPDKVYEEAGKVTRKAIDYFVQQQQQQQKPKKPVFAPVPGVKQTQTANGTEDPKKAFMRRLLMWDAQPTQ